ncbi:ATP-grasp domain-containing protein [Streptomyces sp. B1866]|uniref:ATP-grasp domain-containing protein n=1 Tax=Streptomyces sp. B1866 TaxID=3075431 RepID=UPI00288EC0EA|nr:ATP-grasp domain-containing protein [Streptomyces sp. B1866]MDT3400268.1 ATP-grasp domain-containing protein [Streptomyces sp. B1866]
MTLCVLFSEGAISPRELLIALENYDPIVFAVGNDTYARSYLPLIATAGTVVELTGDATVDATRLKAAGVTGIVTYSEGGIPVCAPLTERLGLPGHEVATATALTDKHTQRALLSAAGAGGVDSRLITCSEDWDAAVHEIGLPLVVKPRCGERSRNARPVRDAEEGRALVARLLDRAAASHEKDLVAEQYLVGLPTHPYGDYVSVESVSSEGIIRHIGVTGKFPLSPPFREMGHFCPAPFAQDLLDQVEELVGTALGALGVRHGITHTEVKLTAQGPRIIEVNGRLGGFMAALYRRSQGLDLIQVAADLALGRPGIPEGKPDGLTHFQYTMRAPLEARRLVSVSGRDVLLGHPLIDAYQLYVIPGAPLDPDMTYLDCVSGSAGSPEEMMHHIDECLALLTYEFEMPDGPLRIDGAALRAATSPAREAHES